jgi:hypothetical protein
MKKSVIFAAVLCIAGATNAQDVLTSKKGVPILPEAGNYSIGIDATPFLDYAGNMFNGNAGNVSPGFSYNADRPFSIYGKYFIDANSAYRATFRLGFNSSSSKNMVADASPGAAADDMVEDVFKNSAMNITLGFGKEWRRGKGRLQGVYGGEGLLNLNSSKVTNEYGNDFEDVALLPGDFRTLETKNGLGFGISVRGFVGVEYFIAPKMSLGAEYGYALGFNVNGYGESTQETFDGTNVEETTLEDQGTKSSGFGVDTDASGFNIKFNFHF